VIAPFHPESTGIIGLATELFALAHNRGLVRDAIGATDQLINSLDKIRAPLISEVRALVRRSEDLGTISGDESVDQLASDRHDIDLLATRFKQLSTLTVPLGEQRIVLGGVRGNLAQAMDGTSAQYTDTGRYLLLRLGVLAAAIAAVVVLSGIWRRVSFRYIRDARRRTQFLMLRRVLVACAVTVIVVMSFVSEFGSLATYAGLLTAGIAVALQNVILSVVAYFYLIGRYGVRTGDRVTISGVTGTVLDIGLVRLYLAELAGSGGEWHPTGRVVVYSNSVLFQPSALFKQMPETDYVWHTVRLVLAPESDYKLAERRISEAVDAVYAKYRQGIEQQHAKFERAIDAQMAQPQPEVRLRYSEAGLEALVHYPAQIKHAALTDSEVVRALENAIASEPGLTLEKAGNPKVVANAA
jgi:small-conductance mechanosensitive channel